MGVQAIDQTTFSLGIGKDQSVLSTSVVYSFGKEMYVYFFKNKLRKYVTIRLHNLKLDTDIIHITSLKLKRNGK
jgi:hypothetical protein